MDKEKQVSLLRILVIFLGFGLVGIAITGLVRPAAAAVIPTTAPAPQTAFTYQQAADNSACLACHGQPGMTRTLPNGEILSLTIDQSHFSASAHQGLNCTDCHKNISDFPHPDLKAQSLRDFSMQMYTTCQQCHATQYNQTLDSVHQKALAGGNTNAAICTDCHNPHTQTQITDKASGKDPAGGACHDPAGLCALPQCHLRPIQEQRAWLSPDRKRQYWTCRPVSTVMVCTASKTRPRLPSG